MTRKSIIYTISALALAVSCSRTEPQGTGSFLMAFSLPDEFGDGVYYSGQKVYLKGTSDYEFETDGRGSVSVGTVIPGIYDIITGMELTGAQYKAMLGKEAPVEDRARINIGVSLMNQRIFTARDMKIQLSTAILKDLLISKIYYSGTKDNMGRNYTSDSYIEIFNNSDEVAYMDGKYLGLSESVSPAAYPASENPDSIYLRQVCRFPGTGRDYPVQPGGSVLIAAKSARNHTESASTSVDLSKADFEVKSMEGSGNPDIPMLPIVTNSTNISTLNLISGGPNTVVLFETDEDVLSWARVYQRGKTSGELFLRMHRKWVMDGVECLKKPAQTAPDVRSKRLQSEIDAGYAVITSVNGYNHESVERRVSGSSAGRYYLMDTNNSSVDFAILTDPTPRKYDKESLQ